MIMSFRDGAAAFCKTQGDYSRADYAVARIYPREDYYSLPIRSPKHYGSLQIMLRHHLPINKMLALLLRDGRQRQRDDRFAPL